MSEFMQTLEKAAKALRDASEKTGHHLAEKQQYQHHKATIATLAGLDLFMRFVTRNSHDFSVSHDNGMPREEKLTCDSLFYDYALVVCRSQNL
jgi:hypothetical protein